MGLFNRLHRWEQGLHANYDNLPDTPEGARMSDFYMNWLDHAVLRGWWTNMAEVSPGVWRGNHPTPKRWRELKDMGIKTVLNLRAESTKPFYQTEVRFCEELGFDLISVPLSARAAPAKDRLLRLIDVFRTIEHPFFMHCKSGADRTGLASAIYMLVIEGKSLSEARTMLSPKFLHFKSTKTGVLDAVLDAYEQVGGDFETWVRDHYDQAAHQEAFNAAYNARKGRKS